MDIVGRDGPRLRKRQQRVSQSAPTNKPETLSRTFVDKVKQPGVYTDKADKNGLYLRVQPTKSGYLGKSWGQRLSVGGKQVNRGLGRYSDVTLDEARRRATKNRRSANTPVFRQAVEMVIAIRSPTWRTPDRTAESWRSSLGRHAYSQVGNKPVAMITAGDIKRVLELCEDTRPAAARKVRQRISMVLEWAVGEGHRDGNPARYMAADSSPRPSRTEPVEWHLIAEGMKTVDGTGASETTKLVAWWMALTVAKTSAARLARWEEIDRETRTWTVPGERGGRDEPHVLPLSDAAVRTLDRASRLPNAGHDGLIFPNLVGKPLSDAAVSKLFKENSVGFTPLGIRSAFARWCDEVGVPLDAERAALGKAAWARGDSPFSAVLDVAPLMEAWSRCVTGDELRQRVE